MADEGGVEVSAEGYARLSDSLVDRIEGALIAVRGLPVRQQAEALRNVLVESGVFVAPLEPLTFGGGMEPVVLERRERIQGPLLKGPFSDVNERVMGAAYREGRATPAEAFVDPEQADAARRRAEILEHAREAEVEATLDAFVAGTPAAGQLIRQFTGLEPDERVAVGWVGESELHWDGQGRWSIDESGFVPEVELPRNVTFGRLFCLSVAPMALGAHEFLWLPGTERNRHGVCGDCGTEIRMHRFVPEGESACSLTDGGHLPNGRCECITQVMPVGDPFRIEPSLLSAFPLHQDEMGAYRARLDAELGLVPASIVQQAETTTLTIPADEVEHPKVPDLMQALEQSVLDARAERDRSRSAMAELGRELDGHQLCDLSMPHDVGKRAPAGCPPRCPAREHAPTINGVQPYIDLQGGVHSPLCASARLEAGVDQADCNCGRTITAGEGRAYEPGRDYGSELHV